MTQVAYLLYFAVLTLLALAPAALMAAVYGGRVGPLVRAETALLRLAGTDPAHGMGSADYALAVLAFNLAGVRPALCGPQASGPAAAEPGRIAAMAPDLAFYTAVSFVTNTTWQGYSGVVQLSYLSQMAGLTVQNFVSAGTGMAVALAVIRGFTAPRGADPGRCSGSCCRCWSCWGWRWWRRARRRRCRVQCRRPWSRAARS